MKTADYQRGIKRGNLIGKKRYENFKIRVLTAVFANFKRICRLKPKNALRQPEPKDGKDAVQVQRIGGEIIRPRDRATHGNKQMA